MTLISHSRAIWKTFPDDWLELDRGGVSAVAAGAQGIRARASDGGCAGAIGSTGRRAWFLPGKFRFCPACKHQPPGQAREINKLAGLSAEGRSSATTLLVSSAIRWMNTTRWHPCHRTVESCLASPTIAKMPLCRRAISTIFCSWRFFAAPFSQPFARLAQLG